MTEATYCYAAEYSCKCEECKKNFSGIAYTYVRDGSDQSVLPAFLPNSINDMLGYAEARLAKKRMETNSAHKPYSDICFTDAICPHCGSRQSWRPLSKPEEPSKPGGPIGVMILSAFFLGIIGMLIGLFVMIFADTTGLVISTVLGAALGLLIGLIGYKQQKEQELENYRKAMEMYPKNVKKYEEFQRELEQRKELYAPMVDIEKGRFMTVKQVAETSPDWPNRM